MSLRDLTCTSHVTAGVRRAASWRAIAVVALLPLLPVAAAQQPAQQPVGQPEPRRAVSATTVFVDANFGVRKNGAARALTQKHAEMEAQGWRFAHLAPYMENGDLVGFFVTYVR